MPGLIRRGSGLGNSSSSSSSSSGGDRKFSKWPSKGGSSSSNVGGKKPLQSSPLKPSKLGPSKLGPSKLDNTKNISRPGVRAPLLPGGPTAFLPDCPPWIRAPSLWAPRFSPRVVQVTELGFGRYGSCVAAVRQLSRPDHGCVVKQFRREALTAAPRLLDKVLNEWAIHSALHPHPHVIPLYGATEDKTHVTLIMEEQRGDLLSYLNEQDLDVMTEDDARAVVADVLAALAHMHQQGFVHRDLKPENVFAAPSSFAGGGSSSRAEGGGVGRRSGGRSSTNCWRLGDLGSAVDLNAVSSSGTTGIKLEGSPPFLAPEYAALWIAPMEGRSPEQLQAATTAKLDIWGVGALTYDILIGHPPFSMPQPTAITPTATSTAAAAKSTCTPAVPAAAAESEAELTMPELAEAIMRQQPSPSPYDAVGLSSAAADFIFTALRKAPEERPSAEELLRHPWLAGRD